MDNVQSNDFERWVRDHLGEGFQYLPTTLKKVLRATWDDGYRVGFEDGSIEADESAEER